VAALTARQIEDNDVHRSGNDEERCMSYRAVMLLIVCWVSATSSGAGLPDPQPLPEAPAIVVPRDVAYPGTLQLTVDATDLRHRVFNVHETIPVQSAGDLVLLYPRWLPGAHAPEGTIAMLAGLNVHAGGAPLAWHRDTVDVFAFHVPVPRQVTQLEIDYQYLSPVKSDVGPVVVTQDLLALDWNTVVLYPAGYFARRIAIQPSIRLPAGWSPATALEVEGTEASVTHFRTTSVEALVDSPLQAGRYYKRYDLSPEASVPVHLDIVADRPELTEISPTLIDLHRALVRQAHLLFGSHHYDHYDFLCSLSDTLSSGITIEHQRSAEYGLPANEFSEWDKNVSERDLLPHEYVHSWDGKFRRPADLWTPNFNVPMRDTLLWVYEGGTQYWGMVLAARAGLWTKGQTQDRWAYLIADLNATPGRAWRNIQDTTSDEIINPRLPMSWRSWQRFEDYYFEGALMWLEADTLIRERSQGKRSLDDFAQRFFGVQNGRFTTLTYRFEDVVQALNGVEPMDWARFLQDHLDRTSTAGTIDGLARSGYRLIFTDKPSEYSMAVDSERKQEDFWFSLGFVADKDGQLKEVLWDSPAYRSGLTAGAHLIAVNGVAYDPDRLRDAVKDSKNQAVSLELLVRSDDRYRTISMDYHDGLRYPHLERVESMPGRLDEILAARP
jgi:predicted metalloprotease with PDZ domain